MAHYGAVQPGVFRGEERKDTFAWLDRFNKICRINGWDDARALRKMAWYLEKGFQCAFLAEFHEASYKQELLKDLLNYHQGSREPVDRVLVKLKRGFVRAGIDQDSVKLRILRQALRRDYATQVFRGKPSRYRKAKGADSVNAREYGSDDSSDDEDLLPLGKGEEPEKPTKGRERETKKPVGKARPQEVTEEKALYL
ncbi:hypothetical protein SYNPS1DRAFT_23276 [Syncephalis pseudoplumigaleata]|uniref:Retrotransposon gag domain-containing protein n=1 Tax=Syncephalis pseudoplumigaleata TaxID=1712513 RepID=A0A4P9YYL5_9FUNG|nr:hypothetical protein SYNPS1DRAFT_23276 [Syncephalis pseudoplumigaleata]|eukprot:RKP24662.1 hypothetical protein SYNPS1DRAFT_23276 [Syncephalis pseudoplumigaleata]